MNKARLLLVDDHPLVRTGLAELINRTSDLVCCGEAGTAFEAQRAATELKPDLVLLDLRLSQGDGLELLKVFKSHFPSLKVLVLSQLDELTYAERTLRAGAKGYVMKENATNDILSAIRQVLAGGIYVSSQLNELAVRRMAGTHDKADNANPSSMDILTDRELQVFELLGKGESTRKIANDLHLSLKTIESHRENIKRKLGLRDAAALVHRATVWKRNEIRTDKSAEISQQTNLKGLF
ncbi:MAG TPA: response regulator transcription factor [Candidatus Sulfotelmatobacter sp.]|nr:response regulator transcription factor [Candidatus Sulfotelmatobacter sp.]